MKRLLATLALIAFTAQAAIAQPYLRTYGQDGQTAYTPTNPIPAISEDVATPMTIVYPTSGPFYRLYGQDGQTAVTVDNPLPIVVTSGIGTGTVTSFSAGALSPLFTTSVATATTTPALTFSLSNAAANTVLGNATGSSAAPGYTSAPSVVSLLLSGTTMLRTPTSLTNIGLGNNALPVNTSGTGNVAMGGSALLKNTTGTGNTSIGSPSLANLVSGNNNTAVGKIALEVTTGNNNTAVGESALSGVTTVDNNTALGYQAGSHNSTGTPNLFLGTQVGSTTLSTGSNNILIGTSSSVDTPLSSTSNFLDIGNAIYGTGIMGGTVQIGINQVAPAYTLDVDGTLHATGTTTLDTLAGGGTQMVVADNSGNLGVQAIPGGPSISVNGQTPVSSGNLMLGIPQQISAPNGLLPPLPPNGGYSLGPLQELQFAAYGEPSYGVIPGPDGYMYILAEAGANPYVLRVTTDGTVVNAYTAPFSNGNTFGGAFGVDGRLWVCDGGADKFWAMDMTGTFTSYSIPTGTSGSYGLVAGSDGRLWAAESTTGKLVACTVSGTMTEYPLPASGTPTSVINGPNGNIFFGDNTNNVIGQCTPAGVFTTYAIPTPGVSAYPGLMDITGKVWFGEYVSLVVAKFVTLDAAGNVTEIASPDPTNYVGGGAALPDGNVVWSITNESNGATNMYTLNTNGITLRVNAITAYRAPSQGFIGSDGSMWAGDVDTGYMDVFPFLANGSGRGYQGNVTTVAGSVSGNFQWTMPEQGLSYKKFVLSLQGVSDAGSVFTFPTPFINTPDIFIGNIVGVTGATVSTTALTLPATTAKTGTITVEGF